MLYSRKICPICKGDVESFGAGKPRCCSKCGRKSNYLPAMIEYIKHFQCEREQERNNAVGECPISSNAEVKAKFGQERLTYSGEGRATTGIKNIEPEISERSPFETLWYRGAAVDKLKMYEDAQEQGLLHFSPCKEGTPLWCAVEIGEGDFSVDVIKGPDGKQLLILNDFYVNGFTEQCYGVFEKDWFLTEDEARKAVFSNDIKF